MIAGGRVAVVSINDLTPLEGGVPIIINGEVVGGIGVSGVTAQQDALVAEAGSRAVAP
jgi:glc operon protein GlcG